MDILKDERNQNYIKDVNPYNQFNKIDSDILSFYMKYNHLKNIFRQGWLKVRIGIEHKDKCESIADHSFSVALLALTIIEKNKLNLDPLKCLKIAILHELGEVYAGDFTPYDNITKEDKHLKEREAILEVLESMDFDNDYMELWEEYEASETEEAKFIKNVDKLEFILQGCAYGFDAACFEKSVNSITDPYCREVLEDAIKLTKGNKKPKVIG